MLNAPSPPACTIHEAACATDGTGAVIRGESLDFAGAVAQRRAGKDIVVCGNSLRENRRRAYNVTAAVGIPGPPEGPHDDAGPQALPHFHLRERQPDGHAFFEAPPLRAR